MRYEIVVVSALRQNCSVIWCEKTSHAAIVDPGGDIESIRNTLQKNALIAQKVLLTHAHIDHVGAALACAQKYHIPIEGPHREDDFWLQLLPQQANLFGFPPTPSFSPNHWLKDGDSIALGAEKLEVLHCPGHTPGHVIFFHRASQHAWVGDVLFKNSVGRTDFPKGNHEQLMASITNKLLPLGDNVTFIPGHGPTSTIGEEKKTNPYLIQRI